MEEIDDVLEALSSAKDEAGRILAYSYENVIDLATSPRLSRLQCRRLGYFHGILTDPEMHATVERTLIDSSESLLNLYKNALSQARSCVIDKLSL